MAWKTLVLADVVEVVVAGVVDDELHDRGLGGGGGESVDIVTGTSSSRRPWPSRIGQVTWLILASLSKRCRKRSVAGRKGKLRRDMSAMLVKVLKAIRPATGFRDARSMATAPPSDQPAATIFLGSMSLRP